MRRPGAPFEYPISILLPVYNGEAYLRDCIASALAQTHREFELLVSDDGSSDASVGIVKSFNDPRVRLLPQEGRHGLFGNLNRLVQASRSPILQILCQDDRMETTCLADVLRFFARHSEVGMLFSKFYVIDGNGRTLSTCALGDLPEVMPPQLSLQHYFYHGCVPSNLSTVAVRKVCLEKAGGFDPSFDVSADYEMWVRLCRRWDMGVLHKHLLRIRHHARQLSAAPSSLLKFIEHNRRIRHEILPLLPPEIQAAAREYEVKRHHVLDVHAAVRSALAGRPLDLVRVARILGPSDFARASVAWLSTLNNRVGRPEARWVLPESPAPKIVTAS